MADNDILSQFEVHAQRSPGMNSHGQIELRTWISLPVKRCGWVMHELIVFIYADRVNHGVGVV
ncbi:MAG TPA: hypothetical protein VJS43_07295 [Candidatus Acidoferrales bacterium]|nr:hypothetical protein [Candidatus Acidoferrales bacterium]